uniref:Uncharacterized protein n=1 Tax=Arundo donax TaxID=35708 RepID=A0A0A8ZUN4_ARUDO
MIKCYLYSAISSSNNSFSTVLQLVTKSPHNRQNQNVMK